jgi:hypothetical protein
MRPVRPKPFRAPQKGQSDRIRFSLLRFLGWGLVNELESKKRT